MSRNKPDLVVDFCNYKAAKFAVMNWHYSKAMPVGKLVKVGVWENGKFIGCVLFGRGTSRYLGMTYGLKCTEVCELVRVALTTHVVEVSKIVSLANKLLTRGQPGLRLLVSYADPEHAHSGVIYQAMNWVYVGTVHTDWIIVNKKLYSPRTISASYGTRAIEWLRQNVDPKAEFKRLKPKHKYLYPLDKKMRRQILPLAQPYPKRADVV